MATWPANGVTDWNTKSLAYLAVSHATNGYHKHPVNGTPAEVRTIYFTGTLDADSGTNVAHGVSNALTKILSVTVLVYDDVAAIFRSSDILLAAAASACSVGFDATNVIFGTTGANLQGNAYRIKIDYLV